MGKKKQTIIGVGPDGSDLICDSKEEMYFTWWMRELVEAGYINTYSRAESIILTEGVSAQWRKDKATKKGIVSEMKSQDIISEHKYTPDFKIVWNTRAKGLFFNSLWEDDRSSKDYIAHGEWNESIMSYESTVEIKPSFDFKNMTRAVKINIGWVFESKGLIVDLVIPTGMKKCLFDMTFVPVRFMSTDTGSSTRTINKFKAKSLSEFLSGKLTQERLPFL
jgi:hypothetical protein